MGDRPNLDHNLDRNTEAAGVGGAANPPSHSIVAQEFPKTGVVGSHTPDSIDGTASASQQVARFSKGLEKFIEIRTRGKKEGYWGLEANKQYWKREPGGYWALRGDAPAPSTVLQDMIGKNARLYKFECANFVYFAQLHGIMNAVGSERFDKLMEKPALHFNIYKHNTQFITPFVGARNPSEIPMGADITLSVTRALTKSGHILVDMTQLVPQSLRNEHVLKLGSKSYFAYPWSKLGEKEDFEEILKTYASVIVKHLATRKFLEFKDYTDRPMTQDERITFIADNHFEVSTIYDVALWL